VKLKESIIVKDVVVKTSADFFLPFSLVLGFYVILHGHISPGGGFQGGVIVAVAAVLIYFGYGNKAVERVIKPEFLRKNEAVAAIGYVILVVLGVVMGANFCRNVFFDNGSVGDFISAGTIAFMNYAVGYKVLTGVAFLMFLMLALLAPDHEDEEENDMK